MCDEVRMWVESRNEVSEVHPFTIQGSFVIVHLFLWCLQLQMGTFYIFLAKFPLYKSSPRWIKEECSMFMKFRMCLICWMIFFRRFLPHDAKKHDVFFPGFFSMQSLNGNGKISQAKAHVSPQNHLSSVQNPGWLVDIGDYTTQLYGDYNKPYKDPYKPIRIQWNVIHGFVSRRSPFSGFCWVSPRSFLWIHCIFHHFPLQPCYPWDSHGIQHPSSPSCNRSAAKPCGIEPWSIERSVFFCGGPLLCLLNNKTPWSSFPRL